MKNSQIKKVIAREILDSRGKPTVEVKIFTDFGIFKASVPSGASTGEREAKELRDGGRRYFGQGVSGVVNNINKAIAKKIKGESVLNQERIDKILLELDGTPDKSHLGANALLPVSIAVSRAAAFAKGIPLYQYLSEFFPFKNKLKIPLASFNILNGGAHAGNELDVQEFMIIPQEQSFKKNLQIAAEVYHSLREILKRTFGESSINLGDEGGFAPPLSSTEEALSLLREAAKDAGYEKEVKFGIDCAASNLIKGREYQIDKSSFTSLGLLSFYNDLVKEFPIIFIEDPYSQDDWSGFQSITKRFRKKIIIFGDDLTTTNPKIIEEAGEKKACTGVIIKPNQIGTLTETFEAIKVARKYKLKILVSHRSGDTCDDFIADLAVASGADFIKSGAPARGERVAKYNRLLEIEEELPSLWKKK